MQERIFNQISPAALDQFHARASQRTFDLIVHYLNGCALDESE